MKSRRQSGRGGAMLPDGGCSGKMERKEVEKNRRLHMKGLCLKLSSLLPASSAHHLRHYSTSSSSPPSSNKVPAPPERPGTRTCASEIPLTSSAHPDTCAQQCSLGHQTT